MGRRIGNPKDNWSLEHFLSRCQWAGLGQKSLSLSRLGDSSQPAPVLAVFSSRPSFCQLIRIFNEWTLLVKQKRFVIASDDRVIVATHIAPLVDCEYPIVGVDNDLNSVYGREFQGINEHLVRHAFAANELNELFVCWLPSGGGLRVLECPLEAPKHTYVRVLFDSHCYPK